MKKLWGSRFQKKANPLFEAFSRQPSVDAELLTDDIQGSLAHAKMLGRIGILSKKETAHLVGALSRLWKEAIRGKLKYDESAEDVHTFVEALLEKKIGDLAKKLHTARSRNDQVSLDTRLYCKRKIILMTGHLQALQRALVGLSKKHEKVIIPGYTHLQHAQPVLLAHYCLAYCEMLERDKERLEDALRRVGVLPLGSGAIAGSSIPIDREFLAKEIGFSKISENSVDAVSDRDFVIEVLSAFSILAMHLSRLSEELILWSSAEFGFVVVDESFCTGSSMMPQKRNPDFLELVRGEAGRVYGNLLSILVTMKGLPLSYNRDMQLDKAPLMDTVRSVHQILTLFPALLGTLTVKEGAIRRHLSDDGLLATDIAEYLVKKGIPFRTAHEMIGKLIRSSQERGRKLASFSLAELRKFSPKFGNDIFKLLSVQSSIARKVSFGGTGTKEVRRAITRWEKRLSR